MSESSLDDIQKKAADYVERFWYEQPEEIKSKINLAYRAGYTSAGRDYQEYEEEDYDDDDDDWDEDDWREKEYEDDVERAESCTCGAWIFNKKGDVIHVADCCCGAE